ncbi:MAG: glutamate--tRNA ligase [Clostridiales bacterium]|nr:glutamate--tRNA ligase [Clostridiales bacterium]
MTVRVRFAPSPTGYLHIGGARTALFNYLFARHEGGTFILRVEDTDPSRSREELVRPLLESFAWLGIEFDEGPHVGGPYGPYFQAQRLARHQAAARRLLEEGKAYPCYCTPEELAERREAMQREGKAPRYDGRCRYLTPEERKALEAEGRKPALRLKVPEEGTIVVHDLIRGDVTFSLKELDDFVLLRSDGTPTYNFAVVVDDSDMAITHVIRAEEHLSNTPKQLLVYEALGLIPPAFAHVPMVLAPDRSKLSKRHGAVAVEEFREKGFLPEAILNYLALLGWSPGGDEEILTLEEMIQRFRLEDVGKTAAIYDVGKMEWLNGQWIRRLSLDDLLQRGRPFLEEAGLWPQGEREEERLRKALLLAQPRLRTLRDLPDGVAYSLRAPETYDEKGRVKYFQGEKARDILLFCAQLVDELGKEGRWTKEAIEGAYRQGAEGLGVKAAELIHRTRLAVTGKTMGPGLFELLEILEPQEVARRLRWAAERIEG